MTLITEKFQKNPLIVEAVRVVEGNANDVAEWCGGEINEDDEQKIFIQVYVLNPMNERQTKAYIGDWVLYAGRGFKVYKDRAFKMSFVPIEKPDEITPRVIPGRPVRNED